MSSAIPQPHKSKAAKAPAPRKESVLEKRFRLTWRAVKGPELVQEFQFHPVRKWRADFVHVGSRTMIECEGGIHSYGRHNRASGFIADCEKYLEAALLGWRVIRLTGEQINAGTLERIARFCEAYDAEAGGLADLFA